MRIVKVASTLCPLVHWMFQNPLQGQWILLSPPIQQFRPRILRLVMWVLYQLCLPPRMLPTESPTTYLPTTFTPSVPAYVCNPDPRNCGCPDKAQADYCGGVNTTIARKACVRWDDRNLNSLSAMDGRDHPLLN